MSNKDLYTYHVAWCEDDNQYIGLCSEFSSLSWLAADPESAFQGIRQVVADSVVDMEANHEVVPFPLSTSCLNAQMAVYAIRSQSHDNGLDELDDDQINGIIQKGHTLRRGWGAQFAAMSENGDDQMLDEVVVTEWDAAEYLETDEDILAYLKITLGENDPELLAAALDDIARAKGIALDNKKD